MVTDDPSSRQFVLSEKERLILESTVRRTQCPQAIALRANILLAADDGLDLTGSGEELGCSRQLAGRWRKRFAKSRAEWGAAVDEWDLDTLTEKIAEALEDGKRSGAPATFTPEQLCQIVAMACEKRPAECDRPVSHWTARELADEAVKRRIVPSISPRHIGRFLKRRTFARTGCAIG